MTFVVAFPGMTPVESSTNTYLPFAPVVIGTSEFREQDGHMRPELILLPHPEEFYRRWFGCCRNALTDPIKCSVSTVVINDGNDGNNKNINNRYDMVNACIPLIRNFQIKYVQHQKKNNQSSCSRMLMIAVDSKLSIFAFLASSVTVNGILRLSTLTGFPSSTAIPSELRFR